MTQDEIKNKPSLPSQLATVLHSKIDSNEEPLEGKNNRFFYSVKDFNILLEEDINAENLSQPKVFNLPYAPKWCSGVVNIRGIIVPIVNMNFLLKTKTSRSIKSSKLLLIKNNNIKPIILQIDQLPTIINFDNYSSTTKQQELPKWAEKTFSDNNKNILEINHTHLLNQLKDLH